MRLGRRLLMLGSAAGTEAVAATAAAATPVEGAIAGPVTAVRGSTFTVETTLSPTGGSLVKPVAKTVIIEQARAR